MKMKKRLLSLLLAAVLAASLALPAAAAKDSTGRFSDISAGPTAKAVESLRLMGVLDGYSNGTFRPEGQLTRAQFCKMAVCAMHAENQLGAYRTVTVFPDVKPSHWAAAYINMAAKGEAIISGYPDGRFYPDRVVSLGQAVTILLRMLGYKDENIGGVWPDSYMAAAARVHLTDGIESTDAGAPLTRKDAARLFVNLLGGDCVAGEDGKGGGKFVSSLGLKLEEDVVLVSSTAVGPDGKAAAFQTASGHIYQLARDTISSGVLNGSKGTLVLENNKVLTFLPDAEGSSRVIVLAAAKANQITDTSGASYAVTSDTEIYYNGEETTWDKAQSWMTPGRSLTLYMGAAGGVEYIFVGGGSASEAVIVYEKGSAKGLSALVGGVTGYKIYKNGSQANAGDLRPYDVATYSSATNSIRVCDTRLTGFYESCSPSPSEPTKIVVMGYEFPVLTTAQSTLAKFKPGDQITLLLTEDNQVAGAVKPGTAGASANAIGIVKEASTSSIEVELLCGLSLKGATTLSANTVNFIKGQPVQVSSDRKGYLGVARLSGGVSGELNLETRKLGSHSLASTVKVYEYTRDGLEPTSLSALGAGPIPNGQISYAHLNWANQVDVLVLGGIHDGAVFYGRTSVTFEEAMMPHPEDGSFQIPDPNKEPTYFMSISDGRTTIGPFRLSYDIPGGTYVQATVNNSGTAFSSLKELNRLRDVSNNVWTGQGAVTVEGRTYTISPSVICFNRDNGTWFETITRDDGTVYTALDQAHAYADKADLYASDDGVIRAIEVRTR